MIIGYGRVSTDGQSLESQLASLKAAGAEKVFAEKISGARADRRALASAIKALAPGDCLIVTRLDRLARSTRDLLNVLDQVATAGAGFRSIADPMIDTTSPHGRLILAMLAALAEFERSMILARTSEGRNRAPAGPNLTPLALAVRLERPRHSSRCVGIGSFPHGRSGTGNRAAAADPRKGYGAAPSDCLGWSLVLRRSVLFGLDYQNLILVNSA
jgi:hypothetical protein